MPLLTPDTPCSNMTSLAYCCNFPADVSRHGPPCALSHNMIGGAVRCDASQQAIAGGCASLSTPLSSSKYLAAVRHHSHVVSVQTVVPLAVVVKTVEVT